MNGKVSMKMQYKNNNQQKKLEIIIEIFRIIYWVKMVQHYYRYLNKKLQYYYRIKIKKIMMSKIKKN